MNDYQKISFIRSFTEMIELLQECTLEQIKEKLGKKRFEEKNDSFYSIHYRYRLYLNDIQKATTMKPDQVEILEKILEEHGISTQTFIKYGTSFKNMIEHLDKKNNNDTNIEYTEYLNLSPKELQEIKNDLIEEKTKLKTYLNGNKAKMYTQQQIEEKQQLLNDTESRIKFINQLLNKNGYSTQKSEINVTEQDAIVLGQGKVVSKEKYDSAVADYNKQIKELEEKINKKDKIIQRIKYEKNSFKTQVNNLSDILNNVQSNEVSVNDSMKNQVKEYILNLLFAKQDFSYEMLKKKFSNLTLDMFKSIMFDIKNYLPGLKNPMQASTGNYSFTGKTDGSQFLNYINTYTLPIDKKNFNGTMSFLVRSDLHLDINLTIDDLKRKLYSHLNYCSAKRIATIDLGDILETYGKYGINDWKNGSVDLAKKSYEFYKNYIQVLSESDKENYILLGNHDLHTFYVGIDPVNIINDINDKIKCIGAMEGQIKVNDFNIGLYHGIKRNNTDNPLKSCDSHDLEYFKNHISESSVKNHDISLIGHYHHGICIPQYNTFCVNNGLKNPLLLNIRFSDGVVTSAWITVLEQSKNRFTTSYKIEIYSSNKVISEEKQKQLELAHKLLEQGICKDVILKLTGISEQEFMVIKMLMGNQEEDTILQNTGISKEQLKVLKMTVKK